jgi:hypothetical protein
VQRGERGLERQMLWERQGLPRAKPGCSECKADTALARESRKPLAQVSIGLAPLSRESKQRCLGFRLSQDSKKMGRGAAACECTCAVAL